MTELAIWGPGPYPPGSKPLGVIKHPSNGALGVAILLASGTLVHGAAGVVRTLPRDSPPLPFPE
jgi:hypothetical protein